MSADESIKVGDLVAVVRRLQCGCLSVCTGVPFVVGAMIVPTHVHCTQCGCCLGVITMAAERLHPDGCPEGLGGPLPTLKKFDPPAEGDSLPAPPVTVNEPSPAGFPV